MANVQIDLNTLVNLVGELTIETRVLRARVAELEAKLGEAAPAVAVPTPPEPVNA